METHLFLYYSLRQSLLLYELNSPSYTDSLKILSAILSTSHPQEFNVMLCSPWYFNVICGIYICKLKQYVKLQVLK